MPALRVRGGEQGEEAIKALGDRLPEVAAHYRKSGEELRGLLRRDKSLRLNGEGRLHYLCEGLVVPVGAEIDNSGSSNITTGLMTSVQTFFLHSKSNSTKKIYLDFNGYTLSGNAWTAGYNGGKDIVAPPWDFDGDPSTFSVAEQAAIQQIWLCVAEDYVPFDVDVTTEDPGEAALTRSSGADQAYGIRVVISPISSYIGNYGGMAYVGEFDSTTDYYKPALIFTDKLANSEKYIAEAISHEVGHTLGLSHDGTTTGEAYYSGQGNWAPIMGVGYYKSIVQWSCGDYANANNKENDLNVIQANGLSYRADDAGDSIGTAKVLSGLNITNAGILERTNDVDFFSIQSLGGVADIGVAPWERGANAHLQLALFDSTGTLLTNREVADATSGVQPVSIKRVLAAGKYFVRVEGVGSGDPLTTGYSGYGSLGNYTLTINLAAPALTVTSPTMLGVAMVGNRLQLSWPADHLGWRLEAQTNSGSGGIGTNWSDVAGAIMTNQIEMPINSFQGSVFFRLAYP